MTNRIVPETKAEDWKTTKIVKIGMGLSCANSVETVGRAMGPH